MIAVGVGEKHSSLLHDHAGTLYYGIMYLVTAQFFVLASVNDMHPFYAVGSVIAVVACASAIGSRAALVAFGAYTMLLALSLFAIAPNVAKVAYWAPSALLLATSYQRLSRQREAEEAVTRAHAELEGRVEERTAQLSRRTEDLSKANEQLHREMEERARLEQQLRLSQKLEALGRLAGGVAHDFNNILTAIDGHAEILRRRLPKGELRADAEQIGRSVERAAGLTRRLVSFSRQKPEPAEVIDVNGVLVDSHPMLRMLMGEDVETHLVLGGSRPTIRADRAQLDQVLVNLAVNARDAMPDGGSFTLETTSLERASAPEAYPEELAGDRCFVLRVSDTGDGMDGDTASRAFDPFFTTKEIDEGSGLGLSIVYGIVQQGGGQIRVKSDPGGGSCFEIYWPSAEAPAASAELPRRRAAEGRGQGRILLVEDEEEVRSVFRHFLEEEGYQVLEAGDGEAALSLARESGPIDLLVTDVVLPRLGGVELAARIADQRPDARVLFVSGQPDHASLREHPLPAGSILLDKPLPAAELTARVRELLDQG